MYLELSRSDYSPNKKMEMSYTLFWGQIWNLIRWRIRNITAVSNKIYFNSSFFLSFMSLWKKKETIALRSFLFVCFLIYYFLKFYIKNQIFPKVKFQSKSLKLNSSLISKHISKIMCFPSYIYSYRGTNQIGSGYNFLT